MDVGSLKNIWKDVKVWQNNKARLEINFVG